MPTQRPLPMPERCFLHATPRPEVGAQCGNSARWDLCGGRTEPMLAKVRPYRDRSILLESAAEGHAWGARFPLCAVQAALLCSLWARQSRYPSALLRNDPPLLVRNGPSSVSAASKPRGNWRGEIGGTGGLGAVGPQGAGMSRGGEVDRRRFGARSTSQPSTGRV